MSEFSNEPMIPENEPAMSVVDTWMAALTSPKESTFAMIAAQPNATASKAFLWVFVGSLFTTFASLIAQSFSIGSQLGGLEELLPPELAQQFPIEAAPSIGFGTVICGAPVGAIFAVLTFAIFVGLTQWVAKLFGGIGSFDKLAYAFSAIAVPYSIISAVLVLLGIIPFVGILTGLISFALVIYVLVLVVLAVKAVNGLDTGKSVGAVLLPGFVLFLFVCCCVIAGMALLGPAIGDVFSEIDQGLGVY